jgi:excisionase family DNA binding protein
MNVLEPAQALAALNDEVMDYRGLSVYLKMAQGTLRHKVMRGEIPFFKINSSVRFAKKDIDKWLAERRRAPGQAQSKKDANKGGDLFPAAEARND